MTVPPCYYGSPEPLPPRRLLRAGPLTAVYEAGDLRYVKVGGIEVCRRWYAAVRDHNWGTVPGVISDEVIEEMADGFRVTYTSTHRQGDIHFVWRAEIVGRTEMYYPPKPIPIAEVVFRFDGEALSTFRRNRIGFCVLHPATFAGLRVRLHHHPDGAITQARFPDRIAPDNPFHDLCGIVVKRHPQPRWTFDGDAFETEDQRNWIDASFKTFCTPLRLPFPVEVTAGERVRQAVTMWAMSHLTPDAEPEHTLRIDRETRPNLPLIGLCLGRDAGLLTDHEVAVLSAFYPHFLLTEVRPDEPDWVARWDRDRATADALDTLIEPALHLRSPALPAGIDAVLGDRRVQSVRVHAADGWGAPDELVASVRHAAPGRDIVAGTPGNFTELNRNRPPLDQLDGVCYSIQPQEHAFDNASLVECCSTIADTVRSARVFCGELPLSVGPVTLRKRVNPAATGPWEPPPPDPRQGSLFGAGWTLAALKYLAESEVEQVAFYELVGGRGVMNGERTFPLFHVLADANEFAGHTVHPCRSSDPLRFDALALDADGFVNVLLANLTADPLTVTVHDLPPRVRVRVLDETTFDTSTRDPLGWRADAGPTHDTTDGRLTLTLRPFAYARVAGDVLYAD